MEQNKDFEVCYTLGRLAECVQVKAYAEKITPDWYFEKGSRIFEEKNGAVRIDAATALADSSFAKKSGALWRHCAGESFGRSGLCLYVSGAKRT